ncbi:hypothetical protein FA15DRAFT_674892 [Coprinopsis marcescibilis]|uniref:Ricin B lectin domain-containing protein n=1 Tax=Coprinopsis marcescibilis TaxID=230819 RepID=A0A5C3KGF8_COPMA|nr:hypothetical protein FA15DRAFT_674892 [Coprinopsis marcescibilis]
MATGFPSGNFVILSLACSRVLDVKNSDSDDGTELILFPCKERTLDETLRNPWNNSQVFFIDEFGCLASKGSGHLIDLEEDRLVIRHRDPGDDDFPFPVFSYNPTTREITVEVELEPENGEEEDLRETFILTSIPKRNPRVTFTSGSTAIVPPNGSFADQTTESSYRHYSQGEEAEVDDSLEWIRRVKTVENTEVNSEKERKKRTWAILPLITEA